MAKISDEEKKKNTANFNAWRQQNSMLSPNTIQFGVQKEEEPTTGLAAALQQAQRQAQAQKQAQAQQVIANAARNYVAQAPKAPAQESSLNKTYSANDMAKGFNHAFYSGTNQAGYAAKSLLNFAGQLVDRIDGDYSIDAHSEKQKQLAQDYLEREQWLDERYGTPTTALGRYADTVVSGAIGTSPLVASYLIPGVGQVAGAAGTFLSSAGMGQGNALMEGASPEDAFNYALGSGALETGTNLMFGGIPLQKGLIKAGEKVASKVGSEALKPVVEKGIDVLGEGVEEGIVSFADPYLQRATYNPNAENATVKEILWDAGVGVGTAALMQGAANLPKAVKNAPEKLPTAEKVQKNDQNRAFEALHGQKMAQNEQKNVPKMDDSVQKSQNALEQEQDNVASNYITNPHKVAQNQSSKADFEPNPVENIQTENLHDINPKLERPQPTNSKMETVEAQNPTAQDFRTVQNDENVPPTDEKSSTVQFEDADLNLLKDDVREFYQGIERNFGGKVRIAKNMPDDMEGTYRNGEIILNANRMEDLETIQFVTVHEFGHKMKGTAEYDAIQEMALKYFRSIADDKDVTDMDLLDYIRSTRKGTDYEIQSDDEAYDEITTIFMEMAFDDTSTIDKICVEQPNLAQRILEFIQQKITDYNAKKNLSKAERQQYDMLSKTRKLYVEGLRKTQRKEQQRKARNIFADDSAKSDNAEIRHSINSLRNDINEGKMREDLVRFKVASGMDLETAMAETDVYISNLNDLADYIEEFQSAFLDMFETYGKDDRVTLPYKDNSDPLYKVSLDFSTLCKKRIITQAMTEELQVSIGRALSAEEQMAIRDYLKELKKSNDKIEVACAMCYVEAARLRTPKAIDKFLDDPVGIVQKYLGTKNASNKQAIKDAGNAKLKELGYEENTTLKAVKANSNKHYHDVKGARDAVKNSYKSTDPAEIAVLEFLKNDFEPRLVLTASGLMELKQKQPLVYTAFNAFVAGQAKAKALQTSEPYYYGDSSAVGDALIEQMNAENGLRHNSWSDFEIIHLLDLLVAVTDLSVRKAKMHYYSKVPAEFYVMKDTEAMGNISMIPSGKTGFNEKGELDFDPVEGVPYEEAMQIREDCSRTAGTVAIGISDAHIKALLESDVIDYVIPYHTSGLNRTLRKMVGIEGWSDYQDFQNEKGANGKNAENALKFSDWFHPTQKDIETKTGIQIMRDAQAEYLRLCKERGITPKFSNTKDGTDFSKHENYWKLLIDRKMIDNDGNIIIQKAVQPNFDFDYMKALVSKEHENSPQDAIDEAVKAVKDLSPEELKARAERLKSGKQDETRNSILSKSKDSNGDFLTKEQEAFFANSKVRDENGNLQVAYHSTDSFGFNVFDKEKSDGMFFFTKNKGMAQTYTHNGGTYEVFLNIENPLIVDAKGAKWNNVRLSYSDNETMSAVEQFVELAQRYDEAINKQFVLHDAWGDVQSSTEAIIEDSGDLFTLEEQEQLRKLAEQIDNAPDDWDASEVNNNKTMTTREIAEKAKAEGHDGVIIKNVMDNGANALSRGVLYTDDVYIAFSPEQIKNEDNRMPTSNPDIRYSTGSSRYQQRVNEIKNIKHKREVSKVYSNTIKNSTLFTEVEKNIELNASEYEYDVKSEKESLHRAAERLENDHAGTSKELMHKKQYTGEDLDAAMFLLKESRDTARETGNYNHARAWLKKIVTAGTEGGRLVQAYAKYSRTTAEGIAVQAERYVQQAEDALKAGHAKGKIAGKEIGKDKDSRKWQKVDGEAKKAQKAVKEAEEKAQQSAEDKLSEILAGKAESMVKGSSKEQELTDKQIVNELYNVLVETGIPDNRKKGETDVYAYLRHAVENKERYTEVWESAKKLLKDKYTEDTELHTFMRDSLDKFFEAGIIPTYSQKTTTKAMKKSAQELGINLKEIIKENDGDKAKAMSQIVDRVVERTGLEQEDATLLAREVMAAYTKTLQEYTDQRLRQLFPELVQPQLEKASKKKTSWFDDIMELINLGAYDNQDIVDIIKQKNDLPVLTSADIETIYSEVEKANQYKKYSYEWKSHMAKAQQVAADKMPQSMKNKVTQLKRIMMLSNPRTDVRNLVGNMPLTGTEMMSNAVASIADKKLSEKRGTQRTISAKPELGAFAQGFVKGFGETVSDIKQGVNTYRMGEESTTQYEMPRGRTFDNAFLNGIDKAVNYGLMFGDRPFFEGHYNKRMAELERLGYDITSDEAKADAYGHAVDMVFQSDSDMAKGASGIREALNNILTVGDKFALGDFVVPFVQTPANIADKLLDYSPVGLARAVGQLGKSNTEAFDQKLFSQRLGRSLTGMGILAVSYALAEAGILTGSSDDDVEKRRAMEASGWKPYSIKIGNTYYDYSFIQPVGMLMAIGADMYKEGQSVDDLTDLVAVSGAGIKGGVNCFFNMSFFSSLTDFFGGYGDAASNMGKAVLDFPTQFAPAITNAVNKTIDPYQRETYDPNPLKQTVNKMAAKLPLASQTLPIKQNVYGEDMMQNQGRNAVQRTAENMLFPSTVGQTKSHKVNDELLRLNDATGSKSQFFAYPDKRQEFGGETVVLSSDEWLNFIENSNGYASRQAENLIGSSFYKGMSDEDKVDAISTVKKYANYKAKKALASERGLSYKGSADMVKMDKAVEVMKGNVVAYMKMKADTAEIKANTSEDKAEIKKYLKRLKDGGTLTDEQYWYMRYDLIEGGFNETEKRACPYTWIKQL